MSRVQKSITLPKQLVLLLEQHRKNVGIAVSKQVEFALRKYFEEKENARND